MGAMLSDIPEGDHGDNCFAVLPSLPKLVNGSKVLRSRDACIPIDVCDTPKKTMEDPTCALDPQQRMSEGQQQTSEGGSIQCPAHVHRTVLLPGGVVEKREIRDHSSLMNSHDNANVATQDINGDEREQWKRPAKRTKGESDPRPFEMRRVENESDVSTSHETITPPAADITSHNAGLPLIPYDLDEAPEVVRWPNPSRVFDQSSPTQSGHSNSGHSDGDSDDDFCEELAYIASQSSQPRPNVPTFNLKPRKRRDDSEPTDPPQCGYM